MLNIYYLIIFSTSLFLIGCHPMQTYAENQKIDEKKLTAARINVRLGMAYLERDDILRAKQKFLLALEEAPTIPETSYAMAYFLEKTDNKVEAKKYYLKAIALAPTRGDTLNNYGTFLCRNKDYRESITYFSKAIKDPNYLETAAAYENAGICARKIPDRLLAEKYFSQALMIDPIRPNSLINLAEINYQNGQFQIAKKLLKRFSKISPQNKTSLLLSEKIDKQLKRYG